MREFTAQGRAKIAAIAQRSGFSAGAVTVMLEALERGQWRMAQFDHPEFGGAGQWMRGGMTMVGDMFNTALKARVQALCEELGAALRDADFGPRNDIPASFSTGGTAPWWPANLGAANSSGAQAGCRYAYFAGSRRLAIESGGRVTLYDTLDHRIGGIAQQQSAHGTLTFTSQHGVIDVAALPVVPADAGPQPRNRAVPPAGGADDVIATIERLADLERRGVLSAVEFAAKKAELLQRL